MKIIYEKLARLRVKRPDQSPRGYWYGMWMPGFNAGIKAYREAIREKSMSDVSGDDLIEAAEKMADVWASVCRSMGYDPSHYVQYDNLRAAIKKVRSAK